MKQGKAWVSQCDAVRDAIHAYGGQHPSKGDRACYWTSTDSGSLFAWNVGMIYGLINQSGKTNSHKVRAVAPLPVASVK